MKLPSRQIQQIARLHVDLGRDRAFHAVVIGLGNIMEDLVLDRIVDAPLIESPALGSDHLQREHVMAVEMGIECLTRPPRTIEIGGTLGAEGPRQTTHDR